VHWGAVEFAAAVDSRVGSDVNTILLHGSQTWTDGATVSGARTIYNARAGAFGIPGNAPTFVFGGAALRSIDAPPGYLYVAWIETSTDTGKTWARTHEATQSFVTAIVYDKANQVFYAQATAENQDGSHYVWQVLRSQDGMSWGVVETAPGGPTHNDYYSPLMNGAADPIYQDGDGNNCAGGVYGYDKAKKILMAPYPDVISTYEGRFTGTQVQIRTEHEDGLRTTTYVDIPGMPQVSSVAYAGGVWQIAGSASAGAVIATSADGATWASTYNGPAQSAARMVLAPVAQ
jgi:hypothetical protein